VAWAFVDEKGVVIDRVRGDPKLIFIPEYAAKFIEAPDDVNHGWTYDGTTFTPPPQPSAEELAVKAAAEARALRDQLLAATDWTQMPDVPQATKEKWAAYRQALRDVPQQAGFPNVVQWPTKPE